ncbi:MAG: copper homeostasis protein CutC [Erysipelotrichaceae bacterium]|nr:copper homeostasis protein CutC [Erysipelotrichaceae bacterium]
MTKILEVCCGSYEDVLAAYRGGAKRVELNSALFMGGLTPSLSTLKLSKENTDIKIISMVRPRGAGFCYSEKEFEVIKMDTILLLENGSDGIAFGFLTDDNEIDVKRTKVLVDIIHGYNKEAVFHRAFDCVENPFSSIEKLIDLKIDRVLTSGLYEKAFEGKEILKQLNQKYGDKIEILAGSGINASNAISLMNYTGLSQIHSSCKSWNMDPTTTNEQVSFEYNGLKYDVVDEKLVKELEDLLKEK